MEAILALEDGRVFRGSSLGKVGHVGAEVVFNTGMTGYQEILTDPSYRGQIVTLTVPHVGNTGVNVADPESAKPQASGLIVRSASKVSSSWRSEGDLDSYLKRAGIVGMQELDTRALTRHLRTAGVLRGCVSSDGLSEAEAIEIANSTARLEEQDLVAEVSCASPYEWESPRGALSGGPSEALGRGKQVVALDFGVKRNILRLLVDAGPRVTVVPAHTRAHEVMALAPDGVFLSNGPGDPALCVQQIETIRELIPQVPIFGICLGHQLTCLALGAETFKLKFGHRGINHPVRDESSRLVAITSQNHGYAVREESLAPELVVSQRSLYDDTVEGVTHRDYPLFTVQYHPEAAPGPHDAWDLFATFMKMMEDRRPLVFPERRQLA